MTEDTATEPCRGCGRALPEGTRRWSLTHELTRQDGDVASVDSCVQLATVCEPCARTKRVRTRLDERLSALKRAGATACDGDGAPCYRCGGAVHDGEPFEAVVWTLEIVRDRVAQVHDSHVSYQVGKACADGVDLKARAIESLRELFGDPGRGTPSSP